MLTTRSLTSVGYTNDYECEDTHVYYGRGFCRASTMMELYSIDIEEETERVDVPDTEKCTDLKNSNEIEPEQEPNISPDAANIILKSERNPSFVDETTLNSQDESYCQDTLGESTFTEPENMKICKLGKTPPIEIIHRPLKDLINKTNKMIYDVDSNHVQYKAGLSKRCRKIPSLHRTQGKDAVSR
ncbi:hypothetical protein TPHA_0M00840 [Tetrapisispora phaffii CBS 4417]|uniref:Uncharacterized protein n=1 Tax=Tetrapisispora phaffii (strain ATCC 24235 / CBS 4417 / NBRC 1672 / NRRL Y-8282 / UCD 70-5) TaxID=1071381 RepID=G8C0E4_TETPH|nr:hypothetical protein TPHA_0M00840 [Tetrapisispora phaffii CBS 4417]CCE65659.1 hypothetical protein TPHA_0M00840 [Tetrapisispora phaffii CBS 4417]